VCENGIISLRSTVYDVETTVAKVQALPVSEAVRQDLVTLLRTGHLVEPMASETQAAYSTI
jgi:hypothetical protein